MEKCLTFLFCFIPFILSAQITTTYERGYSIEFNEISLERFALYNHSDTVINGMRIRNEVRKDSQDLSIAKYRFEYEGDTLVLEKIEVYNRYGIVFSIINYKGVPLEKYSYTCDNLGRVLKRSGFGSGDSGSTTYYVYEK